MMMQGVFRVFEPGPQVAPVVIDVSRSGRLYPVDFLPQAPFAAVHSRISMYVDELMALAPDAGATLLCAQFPITLIDPNRAVDDIDPAMLDGSWPTELRPSDQSLKNGAGLVHTVGASKIPLYPGKLSVATVAGRIERYYEPYHSELARLLQRAKQAHGRVYHLSFHCMSSIDPKNPGGPEAQRPDICLGDRDGTTCESAFRGLLADKFASLGYGVSINKPFKGSEIMRRYGAPSQGVHSLQVELCKRLFMDEKTYAPNEKFNTLRTQLRDIVRDVVAFAATRS